MAAGKNEWVYDELLGFLGSPLFQLPVITFMEARCIIFEPGTEDSQEYREVHRQYKRLVEALLEGFLKDTELSYDYVLRALQGLQSTEDLVNIFQVLFEQVLAMEDFPIFVRLMTQKNIELQQQALLLILHRTGSLPGILLGDRDLAPPTSSPTSQEDEVLKAVLEQSKREYEEIRKACDMEQKELDTIIVISRADTSKLEHNRIREQEKLNEALHSLSLQADHGSKREQHVPPSLSKPPFAAMPVPSGGFIAKSSKHSKPEKGATPSITVTKPPAFPALKGDKSMSSSEAAANWLKSAQADSPSSDDAVSKAAAALGNMSPEQIQQRQEYLRAQRDKLLEMKKKEREKQLLNAEKDLPQRPTSARVAQKAMSGPDPAAQVEDAKKLAMRKAIADRIKSEVMGKK